MPISIGVSADRKQTVPNYMPLMFRTVDGTLVSDNEFADMGLYESEENVENGTEHILPFTDYGSDVESACDLEDEEDLEI